MVDVVDSLTTVSLVEEAMVLAVTLTVVVDRAVEPKATQVDQVAVQLVAATLFKTLAM